MFSRSASPIQVGLSMGFGIPSFHTLRKYSINPTLLLVSRAYGTLSTVPAMEGSAAQRGTSDVRYFRGGWIESRSTRFTLHFRMLPKLLRISV